MISADIGTMDKRITILMPEEYEDENEATRQRMVPFCRTWGRIEPQRGSELIQDYKDTVTEMVKITIRYRPGITNRMAVQYRNQVYFIRYITDPYSAHVKLELVCDIRTVGDVYGYR